MHVGLTNTSVQFSLVIMGVVLSVVWVWSYFVTPFENFAYAPAPIIICNSLLLQVMFMYWFSEIITDVISLLISISIK